MLDVLINPVELFITLALVFLATAIFGPVLERYKIPRLFAPMFLGMLLALAYPAASQYFSNFTISSVTVDNLAELGMLFLLFLIGYEINAHELRSIGPKIAFATVVIIVFDAVVGTLVLYGFGYPLLIAFVAGLSFATVGEAVLLPIIERFRLLDTNLGKFLVGVGTLDDVFEVFNIVLVSILIGKRVQLFNWPLILGAIASLAILYYLLTRVRSTWRVLGTSEDEVVTTSLFVLFTFSAVGYLVGTEAVGALVAGMAVRVFVPAKLRHRVEEFFRELAYRFFGPIFFFWVGVSVDVRGVFTSPWLTLAIFAASAIAKLLASYVSTGRELDLKQSILLGVGLMVRFSTGLVIAQILYSSGLIDVALYSALISAAALSTVVVPFLFTYLLHRWGMVDTADNLH